jgi:eukaryotic-like serine/threonine-protein kinase
MHGPTRARGSAPNPVLSTSSPEQVEGDEPLAIGRYLLYGRIASGGMASVHLGRLIGPVGFSRTVAIKRLHPHFEKDPEFVAMFLDEARIAARIRHPNVVQTLDVVAADGELFLVMDYVEGESLARLLRASVQAGHAAPPVPIVLAILCGALQGLHAAHEAKGEHREALNVVHRDVSPQNILVGVDGTPRVLDFGIAKAMGRLQSTRSGQMKGKLAYMAPEQIRNATVTRRTDVYGASVVLWEALAGSRLFVGDEGAIIGQVLEGKIQRPSEVEPSVPAEIDPIVMRGLSHDPEQRHATALELARELAQVADVASPLEVAEWVHDIAGASIAARAALVARVESSSGSTPRHISDLDAAEPPTLVKAAKTSGKSEPISAPDAETRLTWRGGVGRGFSPRKAALSGVGAALFIALVVATTVLISKHGRSGADAGEASASAPAAATAFAPDSVTAEPTASPEPAVATDTPSASAPAPVRPAPVIRPRTTAKPKPQPVAKDRCNPPFYLDKNGDKVFKPGCLY